MWRVNPALALNDRGGQAPRLTRSTFTFAERVDTSFLEAALRELALESDWLSRDAKGQPRS
jgi:hypothetical protein